MESSLLRARNDAWHAQTQKRTFCLDGYGGIDHGKAVALSANVGEDSTRMHFATEQKEKQ
jgi:hypothetical protein